MQFCTNFINSHCFVLESDSAARDSDTSDGPSDSIATCLQDRSNSQCTSTEVIGGSADLLTTTSTKESVEVSSSSQQYPKVVMRTKRRNSDRPWSVSCLSQLEQQQDKGNRSNEKISNQGLANHSISESALHTLSSPNVVNSAAVAAGAGSSMKSLESKNSLKRRRMRARKRLGVCVSFI